MNMETPSLPTDNLYKFMALGGLVSLLFLYWFFEQRISTTEIESEKIIGENRLIGVEQEFLRHDLTNLGAAAKALNT